MRGEIKNMRKNIILTGFPHSGKSTLLFNLLTNILNRKNALITKEVLEEDKRVGFAVYTPIPFDSFNTTSSVTGSGNLTALWTTINTNFKSIAGYNVTTGSAEAPPIVTTHVPGQIVQFINHTNRISGVVPITANTDAADKPHLEQAIQIGRALTYVIYQVDGREDNAPMLGSFTSILIANTINDYVNVIVTYANTVNNSISTTIDPITFDPINTSNLTYNTVNSIAEFANTLYTLLHDRRVHDENFYTKSNELVNEAKNIRRYENLGASEDNLVQNLIGSDKLKSRLANQ